jgi:hypothetical protein
MAFPPIPNEEWAGNATWTGGTYDGVVTKVAPSDSELLDGSRGGESIKVQLLNWFANIVSQWLQRLSVESAPETIPLRDEDGEVECRAYHTDPPTVGGVDVQNGHIRLGVSAEGSTFSVATSKRSQPDDSLPFSYSHELSVIREIATTDTESVNVPLGANGAWQLDVTVTAVQVNDAALNSLSRRLAGGRRVSGSTTVTLVEGPMFESEASVGALAVGISSSSGGVQVTLENAGGTATIRALVRVVLTMVQVD